MISSLPHPHFWCSKAGYSPFLFELWKAAVTASSLGCGVSHRVPWCWTKSHVFLSRAELLYESRACCWALSPSVSGSHEWDPIRALSQEDPSSRVSWPWKWYPYEKCKCPGLDAVPRQGSAVDRHRKYCQGQLLNSAEKRVCSQCIASSLSRREIRFHWADDIISYKNKLQGWGKPS